MNLPRLLLALAVTVSTALPTSAAAQATTALWLQYETQPASVFQYPDSTPAVNATPTHVSLQAGAYRIEIDAGNGATLLPGAYEGATRWPFSPPGPGLDLVTGSFGCNTSTGRFVVLESAFDGNQVIRLAIDFEHHCEGGPNATYGELRVNSSVPITANRAPGWTTPDPFNFRARSFLTPGAEVLSDIATIYGINAPAPISVEGGQYSINGGPFTADPGVVNNRDKVRLLGTAPAAVSSSATARLTVGSRTVPFTMSTYSEGAPVTAIWLQGTGDYVFGTRTLLAYSPDWSIGASGTSTKFSWSMTTGAEWWSLGLKPASPGSWAIGSYEQAVRTPFAGNAPGVEFTGDGRGCNTIAGRFSVLEATYDGSGNLASFAADFEQRCDGGAPLYGEVRWNSAIPFTFERPADWTRPDPFGFPSRNAVSAGATVISNSAGIYGINAPAPIQVTHGEYRIDGGPWTSAPGTVSNRSRVELRVTASPTAGETVTASLDVGGVVASFSVRTYMPGDTMSALYYVSSPGDWVGGGEEVIGLPPQWTVTPSTYSSPGYISFSINGAEGAYAWLDIAAPPGSVLAPGPYEGAARAPFRGTSPGIDFSANSHGCNTIAGRFVVLDVAWNGNTLSRFAADFEQHCEINGPPLYGEIRYNSDKPISALKPAGTTTPNPFGFAPLQMVMPSTLVESSVATIYGINAPSPISIVGGEYSVDGGPWTSAAGTVNNLAHVKVRLTTSAAAGATATATLTVGGLSAVFSARTYVPGDAISGAYVYSTPGDWAGQGQEFLALAPAWVIAPNQVTRNAVSFTMTGPQGQWIPVSFAAAGTSDLATGIYENAVRTSFRGPSPGIEYVGACNRVYGRFVVLDIAWNVDGTLARFAANFQQSCDGGPWLYGEIRYKSAVVLLPLKPAGATLPDAFQLQVVGFSRPGEWRVANEIPIWGVNADVPISITGGEYSINGGPFTSASGIAHNRDRIVVRVKAPLVQGADATATLRAGGVAAPLSVHTASHADKFTGIAVKGWPGNPKPAAITWAPGAQIAQLGYKRFMASLQTATGDTIALDVSTPFVGMPLPPPQQLLQPGVYVVNPNDPSGVSAALMASFAGLGCSAPSGQVIVHELVVGSDNATLDRAAVDAEFSCGYGAPVTMEVRQHSSIPFSSFAPVFTTVARRDLDGDGHDDLLWSGPGGVLGAWTMNGLDITGAAALGGSGVQPGVLHADFDGDGHIDLVETNTDGSVVLWLQDGLARKSSITLMGPGAQYQPVFVADFDGDGHPDILWRHVAGSYAVWFMNGTSFASSIGLFNGATSYRVMQLGDFDGDGRADLLGLGPDGSIRAWSFKGASQPVESTLLAGGLGWTPLFVADFTGDGRSDVLLRHDDGTYGQWIMNGPAIQSGKIVLGGGTGWEVTAVADLDGDGRSDLIWSHPAGSVGAWRVFGDRFQPTLILGDGSGWHVVATADVNGDGKADLVWRHDDGSYGLWLMDGPTPRSYRAILNGGSGWEVVR